MHAAIPMPPRIANLPQDSRGYPIPWNVLIGEGGVPVFTVNDTIKHYRALSDGLCPLCGERLGKWKWFVGGPQSAFHPNGAYFDLPGHHDCVQFALRVCPWLAVKNYKGRIDLADAERKAPGITLTDDTQDPARPPLFVAVASASINVVHRDGKNLPVVRPGNPRLGVEYWRHGQQLSAAEGEAIVRGLN